MRPLALVLCAALVAAASLLLSPAPAVAQDDTDRAVLPEVAPEGPPIVGDPDRPRGNFRVPDPLALEPVEASSLYASLKARMREAYLPSRHPAAEHYQDWRRYTAAPFLSSPHGNRYVSVYADADAERAGGLDPAGTHPEGATIAMDSFTVTRDGLVAPGALFVMEKMAPGFNPVGGDWRYTMILPDGTVFGTTHGPGSEAVRFCVACHLAAEDNDRIHALPAEARRLPGG